MDQEKAILRWGGLAGILGDILFILTVVILVGFAPPSSGDPAGYLGRLGLLGFHS